MTIVRLLLSALVSFAFLYSPSALPGQDSKGQDKKEPPPKELTFKGTITGLQQEVTHTLLLQKDMNYTLTLHSPGIMTGGRIENNQGQRLHTFNGSTIFKAPEDGAYRMVVYSPGGSSGKYELSMRETKVTVTKAGEILDVGGKDGLTIEAILSKEDPLDKARKKYCKIYDVKMDGGKVYIIHLGSRQFDAFLRLENSEGKQLAKDDDSGGGNNARIRFKAPDDGVYRVYATSFNLETGLFVLKIREE
jgi:hypothetical protein